MSALWERILRYHSATGRPIQLLVAYTADATAATKSLSHFLTSSLIAFTIQPFLDYRDARRYVSTLTDTGLEDLFILVGFGANEDLAQLFRPELHTVIVLDNHRPFHLNNLRNEGEGGVTGDGQPREWLLLWQSAAVRNEVDEFFIAAQRSQKKKKRIRKRRRDDNDLKGDTGSLTSSASSSSEEDDDEDSDEDDDVNPSQAVQWMESVPADLEVLYYSAAFCGKSLAVEMFDLAVTLNRVREGILWYAAVGVTDLLLRHVVDYSTYLLEIHRLREHASLLAAVRKTQLADLDDANGTAHRHDVRLMPITEDAHLHLLRHWSLWSAIWHGQQTAALLRLQHADRGEEHLRELLARCGVSNAIATRSWREVPMEHRTRALELVRQELQQAEYMSRRNGGGDTASMAGQSVGDGSAFDGDVATDARRFPCIKIPNVIPSLARVTGFSSEVSAVDAWHLFNGTVAAPPPEAVTVGAANASELNQRLLVYLRDRFWVSFNLLDADVNAELHRVAVEESQNLQRAITTATSALVQRGAVLSTRAGHYSLLSDSNRRAGAMDTFWTPPRLTLLARQLVRTLTMERGRLYPIRPLVLCCALPMRDSTAREVYLVAMMDEGAVHAPNVALRSVQDWDRAIAEQPAEAVERYGVDRSWLWVHGREAASHLVEAMHLQSASRSR